MPDLISVYDSEGKCKGKCGFSCYAATKPDCKCICGGKNHGIGFTRAMAQTAEITETIIEKGGKDVRNESLELIECQGTELDEDLESHFFKKVVILPDKEELDVAKAMKEEGLFAAPLNNGEWMVGKANIIYGRLEVGSDHYTDERLAIAPTLVEAIQKWRTKVLSKCEPATEQGSEEHTIEEELDREKQDEELQQRADEEAFDQ